MFPVKTKQRDEDVYNHPAFAQISASRINGNAGNLYDSEFGGNNFITLRIDASEMTRSLSSDRFFANERIVELSMSESQWATFISSMNIGSGVPCTLKFNNGKSMPIIEWETTKTETFMSEHEETMMDSVNHMKELIKLVNSSKLSNKAKSEMISLIKCAIQDITCNLDFVSDSFAKYIENTVEKAKQTINGYVVSNVGEDMPLLIKE